MDALVRASIAAILTRRASLLALALQQRAKFEHWLKFELAEELIGRAATNILIEPSASAGGSLVRSDLAFTFQGQNYLLELKTPNTNWRTPGTNSLTRPITGNITGIINDARKPSLEGSSRVIAFAMLPVPVGDDRWHVNLDRISSEVGIPLSEAANASRVDIPLACGQRAQIVVVSFTAPSVPSLPPIVAA